MFGSDTNLTSKEAERMVRQHLDDNGISVKSIQLTEQDPDKWYFTVTTQLDQTRRFEVYKNIPRISAVA